MIAWSIEAAKQSGLFDKVVVSTDDQEIAMIATAFGADVPFMRPPTLADDHTPTVPVIAHGISEMADLGTCPEAVCCIYPCAPFLRSEDLVAGLALMNGSGSNFAYPVAEFAHPVQRALLRAKNGKMQFLSPEHEMTRTQDLPPTFHDAGQFYWGKTEAWTAQRKMHSEGAGLIVPHWRIVDIDTDDDWLRAELLFALLAEKGGD
ncbi:pseudaminic acid cytidylyltransferase [Hydrogenophaga palleronii]|uniref:Pseudaminic acid cytidylyltransferase n=2 Tax=Hydrogenophaga palleronii TaxID=65655 RepID=A0ABU1WST1_9BURK|nr:pseudaminic acid cytidylyltransferase [Hydrogenophaga palleronii]